MKTLNKNTKKAQQYRYNYNNAYNNGYLHEVYGSYSYAKQNALDYCKNLQKELNGYNGKICTHSKFVFTYGFIYEKDDNKFLVYITPTQDYTIQLQ